jgi:tetratricopeptide (TPR) repeat protein
MADRELPPPDSHHLLAASGWLDLGLPQEALAELQKLSEDARSHPDALDVRWEICAAQQDWEAALPLAQALVENAPEQDVGWIHLAYTLRRVPGGGLQTAWDVLRSACDKFHDTAIIPYNLACYAAQFGRLEEAWEWLQRAIKAAGALQPMKQMALADDDLKELWDRIRAL